MRTRIVILLVVVMIIGGVTPFSVVESREQPFTFAPEFLFFYPEGATNGSAFLPRDYIYFTLSGDLTDWNSSQYWIDYKWSCDDSPVGAHLHNGIGYIRPRTSGKLIMNVWHELNVDIRNEHIDLFFTSYQFYADPSLYESQPFSVTPLNYPNNSVIPYWGGESFEYPTFYVTGFTLVNESSLGQHISKMGLNCSYKWDDSDWWETKESFTRGLPAYVSYRNNVIFVRELKDRADNNEHTLYIRLENGTHTDIYRFCYTILDYVDLWWILRDDYFLVFRPDKDVTTYGSGGNNHLSVNESAAFVNYGNYTTLTYNWHDGNGNHTTTWNDPIIIEMGGTEPDQVNGVIIDSPDFPINETGFKYLSFWYENNSIWSPERRHVYVYDKIIPEINFIYPINDSVKIGMIPLIWSLDTVQRGFWDFSQYQFNLYYEIPNHEPILIESGYNPIVYETKTKINQNPYWYLKNMLNYYANCSDPMLLSYEFYIPEELTENSYKVRFIIEETTTGIIPPVTSEWISIKPRTIITTSTTLPVIPTTTTTSTTPTTTSTTPNPQIESSEQIELTTTHQTTYSTTIMIVLAIIIVRKRRNG